MALRAACSGLQIKEPKQKKTTAYTSTTTTAKSQATRTSIGPVAAQIECPRVAMSCNGSAISWQSRKQGLWHCQLKPNTLPAPKLPRKPMARPTAMKIAGDQDHAETIFETEPETAPETAPKTAPETAKHAKLCNTTMSIWTIIRRTCSPKAWRGGNMRVPREP